MTSPRLLALDATGRGAEVVHAGAGSVSHAGAPGQNRQRSPGTFFHGDAVSQCPLCRRGCVLDLEGLLHLAAHRVIVPAALMPSRVSQILRSFIRTVSRQHSDRCMCH